MTKPRILLNLFHPNIDNSRGNKFLSEEIRDLENIELTGTGGVGPR